MMFKAVLGSIQSNVYKWNLQWYNEAIVSAVESNSYTLVNYTCESFIELTPA